MLIKSRPNVSTSCQSPLYWSKRRVIITIKNICISQSLLYYYIYNNPSHMSIPQNQAHLPYPGSQAPLVLIPVSEIANTINLAPNIY